MRFSQELTSQIRRVVKQRNGVCKPIILASLVRVSLDTRNLRDQVIINHVFENKFVDTLDWANAREWKLIWPHPNRIEATTRHPL
jgi:hypothetical protein